MENKKKVVRFAVLRQINVTLHFENNPYKLFARVFRFVCLSNFRSRKDAGSFFTSTKHHQK